MSERRSVDAAPVGFRLTAQLLVLLGLVLAPALAIAEDQTRPKSPPRAAAEWDRAVEALVHTPGEELFFGVIHPDAALFERPFSVSGATSEHRRYLEQLQQAGITCHTLEEVLLSGTLDPDGAPRPGPDLETLRTFARGFITIECSGFDDDAARHAQQAYLGETLDRLDPRELVKIVLLNPHIKLTSTGDLNTGFAATYEVRPVMNLYFLRDQLITTGKGIVIGRMNSVQRRVETRIVRFAIEKLGHHPLLAVEEPGFLEGGDFLPAGERVFIARGLRTNAAAIEQIMRADAFGCAEVVVVKDDWQQQEQMHLDTYFNVISPRLAVLDETRLNAPADSVRRLKADVYRKQEGRYRRSRSDLDFAGYLREDLEMEILPVSREDQENYGVNFLTVQAGEVFVVEGISETYRSALASRGVSVNLVDFRNLTGGYGACRCTVQVLRRE